MYYARRFTDSRFQFQFHVSNFKRAEDWRLWNRSKKNPPGSIFSSQISWMGTVSHLIFDLRGAFGFCSLIFSIGIYILSVWNSQTASTVYLAVCSLCVFIIVDIVKIWRNWRYGGEDETRLPENLTIDAGKLIYYSVSICDKVWSDYLVVIPESIKDSIGFRFHYVWSFCQNSWELKADGWWLYELLIFEMYTTRTGFITCLYLQDFLLFFVFLSLFLPLHIFRSLKKD